MNVSSYRSATHAFAERLADVRVESASLLSIRAAHRAVLPPPMLAELAAVEREIASDLAREPDIHAIARLEQALERLRTLRAAADETAERTRQRPREVPPPPPPRWFSIFERRVTVSIEEAFRAQLPGAEIAQHGTGMLAQLEQNGTRLHFVARGRATSWVHAISSDAWVDCALRAGAPVGPRMFVRTRSGFERVLRRRRELNPEYCAFDESFVVRGDPQLVAELLDRDLCDALSWMAAHEPCLSVMDGVIELAWTDRYNPMRPMLQGAMLHVVTTIARRL